MSENVTPLHTPEKEAEVKETQHITSIFEAGERKKELFEKSPIGQALKDTWIGAVIGYFVAPGGAEEVSRYYDFIDGRCDP